ncbi:hypothetical protein F8M41_019513 [Gigaspora margarita]|uniref:Uncharacterized protein n=1 Tax=Gigaspora margarita TaxID=4874 RepID=A0A8H4AJY0_GIGMA|nr:hypothetical protein F8M41_019513 [Gigaspora margarita]
MSQTPGSLQSFYHFKRIKKKQNKQNETSESESDHESETSTSSSSSSSSAPSLTSLSTSSSLLSIHLVDSALKDTYCIDEKLTWADQKNDIITKLLPVLCKKVDKKYNVSQQELLKMLYGRWRARHREFNIRKQGDEQFERNKRRKAKNSMAKDLLNLLYNRIDLVVELLHKKLPTLRRLRITSQKYIQQACFPPFGAPTWCLTNEALKKLNFPIENIPIYDSEESNEGNNNNEDDDNIGSNDNSDTSKNTKKKNEKEKESKKRSNKKKEKKKKSKKHRK